jgi:tRNA(Ile)-lysidine synthase
VKKYFIDRKIPRERRNDYPVLAGGNHILWIAGLRMDDRCKIDESTRKVLKIELLLA